MRLGAILAAAACALGCSAESRPVATHAALPPGVVASVGGDLVHTATVARIASARGVDRSSARDLAVRDAIFAAALRADPEQAAAVSAAERAALGRALFEALERQAADTGPPSDAEIAEITAERWTELDRPASVRTAHAVVLVKKPEEAPLARVLAERLAAAVRGVTAPAEFIARAEAVPAAPLEIKAEGLSPIAADGRMWDPHAPPTTKFGSVDLDYARAANTLASPGDQSPLVKSAFGYHVILLVERLPEERRTLEERRALATGDIVTRRARKLVEETVKRLREHTNVEVERTADGLTELLVLPAPPTALPPVAPPPAAPASPAPLRPPPVDSVLLTP